MHQPPGTYWEYNDVRINQLALALLHLFRAPLPQVFLDCVLRPLGGGDGFAWRGYVWVDPGLDAVVVLRWLDPARGPAVVRRIAAALEVS